MGETARSLNPADDENVAAQSRSRDHHLAHHSDARDHQLGCGEPSRIKRWTSAWDLAIFRIAQRRNWDMCRAVSQRISRKRKRMFRVGAHCQDR